MRYESGLPPVMPITSPVMGSRRAEHNFGGGTRYLRTRKASSLVKLNISICHGSRTTAARNCCS